MGSSYFNCHFRTEDFSRIEAYLTRTLNVPAYLSVPCNGWVSFYPENSGEYQTHFARSAKKLSKQLALPVIVFFLYDSDVFQYWIYESGELRDEYCSNPAYDGDRKVSKKMIERLRGKPAELQKFCRADVSLEQIEKCLHPAQEPVFADDYLTELAGILGLDEDNAHENFRDIEGAKSVEQNVSAYQLIEAKVTQKYKDESLQRAMMFGEIDKVRKLIAAGANVNGCEENSGLPFLIRAAERGHVAVVRELINAGADVNVVSPELKDEYTKELAKLPRGLVSPCMWERGVTPLMVAAGNSLGPHSIVRNVDCATANPKRERGRYSHYLPRSRFGFAKNM